VRGRGINYDTGSFPAGNATRPDFDPDVVRREMWVIARDLHCTAVRITGGDSDRLTVAGECAAEAGLQVWFAPFPCEMTPDEMLPLFVECADRAEDLRRRGADVVLVTGAELSVFGAGFLPGENLFGRIAVLGLPTPERRVALLGLPARLNAYLRRVVGAVRPRFGGRVTYASLPFERVDWGPFDVVGVDAYRDRHNADGYREELRRYCAHGKPVAVTEFGCCTFQGAAELGARGWLIVDRHARPRRLDADYVRDEAEQAAYLRDLLGIFGQEGIDSAFWFTFACYAYADHSSACRSGRYDLDLASYGVVRVLGSGVGTEYPDLPWEPKASFRALAEVYGTESADLSESSP
jgi:hypothetical protein